MLIQALCLLASIGCGGEPAQAYPRADLLVAPAALATPEIAQQFRILDSRSKAKYDAGHIPGAVLVEVDAWNKAFADKQDAKDWSAKIGALGIDNKTKVVIYDDSLSKDAARVWWILRYWGAKDVRLLNGGFPAFSALGLPMSKEAARPGTAAFAIASPNAALFADKSKVLGVLEAKSMQIIDARSEAEHCGDSKLKNKKAGAIPGALHLEWSDALDPKTQQFKSPAE